MPGCSEDRRMRDFDLATWPPHIRKVFAAIRVVMRSDRLYPEDLGAVPQGDGAILPHHLVKVSHIAARDIGGRKGRYVIKIEGPAYAGQWNFSSGELERVVGQVCAYRPATEVAIEREEQAREEIAKVARKMLTGDCSFIEGSRLICDLLPSAGFGEPEGPFLEFVGIESETDTVPLGAVRERWSPEARERLHATWEQAEKWAEDIGRPVCQKALAQLSATTPKALEPRGG